jgi:hypothetical protein
MLTGIVNPMQLFGGMLDILPGGKFFKKISATVIPVLEKGVNCVGKLTKSADGLTGIWKAILKNPGIDIVYSL